MAKEFTVEGEVGWDIGVGTIRGILNAAGGEDIIIKFASPGGSVFTGLKMFNLIRGYKGNVDFHLIGEAASMGSYIPLAGRKITAEPNVVMMIHNARSFIGGDHNDMRKRADIIEGLSGLLAAEYVKRTGKTKAQIIKMMDDETFFFGPEAVEAGFVDEITGEPDDDPDARSTHVAVAREAFEACMAKVQAEKTDDYEQAAALLPQASADNRGDTNVPEIDNATTKTEVTRMDRAELQAKHPDVYNEVFGLGVSAERDRATAHLLRGNASGDLETAIKAIEDGSEMTETLKAKYDIAGMNKTDLNARVEDDEDTAEGANNVNTDTDTEDTSAKVADIVEAKFGIIGGK